VTEVLIDEKAAEAPDTQPVVELGYLDKQLMSSLVNRVRSEGLQLTGENGLLGQLTKIIVEAAAEGELDEHLGYSKHDPAGRDGGNSRNGTRPKTVLTDVGPVEVQIPRDRDGTFEPQVVRKRQRRLNGIDGLVISLSAKGLTHGQIAAHLAEVYGANVSKQTITVITDRVIKSMSAWQNRPLDRVYPVVFIDAINVKIREGNVANRPIYIALGVTVEGTRDVLGIWAGEHGDGEGAKYWMRVLSEIKNRGTHLKISWGCEFAFGGGGLVLLVLILGGTDRAIATCRAVTPGSLVPGWELLLSWGRAGRSWWVREGRGCG
jgi:putative transposase